jgi:hypothetical protein
MITYDSNTKKYTALSTDNLSSIAVPNTKVYFTDTLDWQLYDASTLAWVEYYAFNVGGSGSGSGSVTWGAKQW